LHSQTEFSSSGQPTERWLTIGIYSDGIELRPLGAGGFTTVDSVERVTIRHRNHPIGVGTALRASKGDR
jgi:hypothetical protein